MFIPNVPTHPDVLADEEHERQLYNELRARLQDTIQVYLQRTQQPYPIRFVFDFSSLQLR